MSRLWRPCRWTAHTFLLEQSEGLYRLLAIHHDMSSSESSVRKQHFQEKTPDFLDPETTLCAADARKYWVFASDHQRDKDHGNSAYMLALYRLFSGDRTASFDSHSGVAQSLPLDLFLRLGCMLVVAIQTEGTVVYVPSAEVNESAHLVTTAPDNAVISVAGNVLSHRHIVRLVRQHQEDGPPENARIEWTNDFAGGEDVSSTEEYTINVDASPLVSIQVPTTSTINRMHAFLSVVKKTTHAINRSTIASPGFQTCSLLVRPSGYSANRLTTRPRQRL